MSSKEGDAPNERVETDAKDSLAFLHIGCVRSEAIWSKWSSSDEERKGLKQFIKNLGKNKGE